MIRFGGKKSAEVSPTDQVRNWKKELKKEMRGLDRQIRQIAREEAKVQREVKAAAKKKDFGTVKILAKELVGSRKARDRIHVSKTQMNSVAMQLDQNMAMMKVSGAMQKSSVVMAHMNALVKLPAVSQTIRQLGMEMEKAGLIEEMMDDAMETLDDPDMDEEVDEEVDKVVAELTGQTFSSVSAVPVTPLPSRTAEAESAPAEAETADSEVADMRARLAAL